MKLDAPVLLLNVLCILIICLIMCKKGQMLEDGNKKGFHNSHLLPFKVGICCHLRLAGIFW